MNSSSLLLRATKFLHLPWCAYYKYALDNIELFSFHQELDDQLSNFGSRCVVWVDC